MDDSSGTTIDAAFQRDKEKGTCEVTSPKTSQPIMIESGMGHFAVLVDGIPLEVGSIVKAKGTLSEFAGIRQIALKRISTVKDTAEEITAWKETAEFKRRYLSTVWILTDDEREAEDSRLRKEEQKQRTSALQAQLKGHKHARQRQDYVRKKEQYERRQEKKRLAAEAEMNAGALI